VIQHYQLPNIFFLVQLWWKIQLVVCVCGWQWRHRAQLGRSTAQVFRHRKSTDSLRLCAYDRSIVRPVLTRRRGGRPSTPGSEGIWRLLATIQQLSDPITSSLSLICVHSQPIVYLAAKSTADVIMWTNSSKCCQNVLARVTVQAPWSASATDLQQEIYTGCQSDSMSSINYLYWHLMQHTI